MLSFLFLGVCQAFPGLGLERATSVTPNETSCPIRLDLGPSVRLPSVSHGLVSMRFGARPILRVSLSSSKFVAFFFPTPRPKRDEEEKDGMQPRHDLLWFVMHVMPGFLAPRVPYAHVAGWPAGPFSPNELFAC